MNQQLIVVGTDTEIGKTVITGLIAHWFTQIGISVTTQKWVQTGADTSDDLNVHDQYAPDMTVFPEEVRCPYRFNSPVSPHFASALAQDTISLNKVKTAFYALAKQVELLICETSGGILVPYSQNERQLDLVDQLAVPVVVVAPNQLGVLNQAMLTVERLQQHKHHVVGVILSQRCLDVDVDLMRNNEATLSHWLSAPVLGTVPYCVDDVLKKESFQLIGAQLKRQLFP